MLVIMNGINYGYHILLMDLGHMHLFCFCLCLLVASMHEDFLVSCISLEVNSSPAGVNVQNFILQAHLSSSSHETFSFGAFLSEALKVKGATLRRDLI